MVAVLGKYKLIGFYNVFKHFVEVFLKYSENILKWQ